MTEEEKGRGNDNQDPWYALARYMGIGLEVAVAIVLSLYAGYKLDQRLGYSPLFLVICLALGFAAVINILLYYSKAATKDAKGDDKK